jgi:RimJ/RimL family protein N-acetyltransferase
MVDYDKKHFIKEGRAYVLRFFDRESSDDLRDLLLIIESPEVQRWMENVNDLSFGNYKMWMEEKGQSNSFLFAIADPRDIHHADSLVHGFIYIYPSRINEGLLEVSYAKRPGSPNGLITPALKLAIESVHEFLKANRPNMIPGLSIIAEIERDNVASIKVAERNGFKMIRDYDENNDALWAVGIEDHHEKDAGEISNDLKYFDKLKRVKQINGTYCAPASIEIMMSHFGIEANQDEIAECGISAAHARKNGMSIESMAKAIKTLYPEFSLWVKRESSLHDIEKMVREFNYPVGVDWQGYFEENEYESLPPDEYDVPDDPMLKGDEGHYSVVIDIDRGNNQIRLIDPYGHYSENDRYFGIEDFDNRWWDDRMDKNPDGSKKYVFENKLMFVIVPRSVRVPEVLGMVEL